MDIHLHGQPGYKVAELKCDAESFIYSICLPDMLLHMLLKLNYISYVYAVQFAITKLCVKLFALSLHACFVACTPLTSPVNGCVSDSLFNASALQCKMLAGSVTKYSNELKRR